MGEDLVMIYIQEGITQGDPLLNGPLQYHRSPAVRGATGS